MYIIDGLTIETAAPWQLSPMGRTTLAIFWRYLSQLHGQRHVKEAINTILSETERFPSFPRRSLVTDPSRRIDQLAECEGDIDRDKQSAFEWILANRNGATPPALRNHAIAVWSLLSAHEKTSDGIRRLLLRYGLDPHGIRDPVDPVASLAQAFSILSRTERYGVCAWTECHPPLDRREVKISTADLRRWVTLQPRAGAAGAPLVFADSNALCEMLRAGPAGKVDRVAFFDKGVTVLAVASREMRTGGHGYAHRVQAPGMLGSARLGRLLKLWLLSFRTHYCNDYDHKTEVVDASPARLELVLDRHRLPNSVNVCIDAALSTYFAEPEHSVGQSLLAAKYLLGDDASAVIDGLCYGYSREARADQYRDLRDYVQNAVDAKAEKRMDLPPSLVFITTQAPRYRDDRGRYDWQRFAQGWNESKLSSEHVLLGERLSDVSTGFNRRWIYACFSLAWQVYNYERHFFEPSHRLPPSLRASLQYLTRMILTALPGIR